MAYFGNIDLRPKEIDLYSRDNAFRALRCCAPQPRLCRGVPLAHSLRSHRVLPKVLRLRRRRPKIALFVLFFLRG